ncbi:MAG: apolipoprotein N-acyltransferase [Alphaproteobacteria bacterium]|nr:apolipoprotein N-acyltransferase [Alphaproteobacteria bacterium]
MTQTQYAPGDFPASRGNLLTPAYLWLVRQQRARALGLAAGFGVLANLAFPPIWFWPAMLIALSGLVWLLDGAKLALRPGRAAFWRVFAFGFAYFLVGLHWIVAAFLVDPGAHLWLIWLPLLILPGGLALILASVMLLAFQLWSTGPARLITFSVLFMAAEWIRGALFGLGGLPWNLPGMAWEPGGAISQSASIWGIYGLSLLTVVALASPAALADRRPRGTTALRAAPAIAAAILFGALWGWGSQRLSTVEQQPDGPMVRLVEAGVPQAAKYDEGVAAAMVRRFSDLTGPDGSGTPSIVIWPEGALPYFLFEWPEALDLIAERLGDRRLIIGVARREQAGSSGEKTYNSLTVLSGDSALRGPLQIYDKHMLVPFGEFTPLADLIDRLGVETLQKLAPGGFSPGPRPAPVKVVGVPAFGPMICYEAIFPGLAPDGIDRPQWLVNISNDSWFGGLSGPYQHAAQARYRSIEEGLPMARVAAGGLTGMIDAYGRWTARGSPADPVIYGADPAGWKSSVVDAPIPPVAAPTPYSRWRDGLFWIIFLGLNLGLLVLPRR